MKLIAIYILALSLTVSMFPEAGLAQSISGTWNDFGDASGPLFSVTFGSDGSYRAECRDSQFCSLCGNSIVVETGTYRVEGSSAVITITSSNVPNGDQRIEKSFTVPFTFSGSGSVTFSNAPAFTFDWTGKDTIVLVQKITGVEPTTWRAVKALFR